VKVVSIIGFMRRAPLVTGHFSSSPAMFIFEHRIFANGQP
jgi:hypothetical protein